MGEAKRRKALDPNYGKPRIPLLNARDSQRFFNKSIDLIIAQASDIIEQAKAIETEFDSEFQVIAPLPAEENSARAYFNCNRDSILQAVEPIAIEHGRGWIHQIENSQSQQTDFRYFPANSEYLNVLETKVFSRSLGKNVGIIMRAALAAWNWRTCVPVISMAMSDDAPAWIFLI